jgi:hypothetical protein
MIEGKFVAIAPEDNRNGEPDNPKNTGARYPPPRCATARSLRS